MSCCLCLPLLALSLVLSTGQDFGLQGGSALSPKVGEGQRSRTRGLPCLGEPLMAASQG